MGGINPPIVTSVVDGDEAVREMELPKIVVEHIPIHAGPTTHSLVEKAERIVARQCSVGPNRH